MKQTAIYPGSFDPITKGHLNIIERASKIFERVVVLVADSSSKKSLFDSKDKLRLIEESIKELNLKNVTVEIFAGLTIDFVKNHKNALCIRGLRNTHDFDHEYSLEQMNKKLWNEFETVFLTTAPEYAFVSSTLIKELVKFKGNIDEFVPKAVSKALKDVYGS